MLDIKRGWQLTIIKHYLEIDKKLPDVAILDVKLG